MQIFYEIVIKTSTFRDLFPSYKGRPSYPSYIRMLKHGRSILEGRKQILSKKLVNTCHGTEAMGVVQAEYTSLLVYFRSFYRKLVIHRTSLTQF